MSDLVKRLLNTQCDAGDDCLICNIAREAAAEITRLTALEDENAQLRTERDCARAAMAKEAAEAASLSCLKTMNKKFKTKRLGLLREAYGTEYAQEASKAILALAEGPTGYVCVKVGELNDLKDRAWMYNEIIK